MLSDECREAELKELEKEWLLSDDWMLGLLSEDCREGLLSVLCRDARRPEEAKQNTINTNVLESSTESRHRKVSGVQRSRAGERQQLHAQIKRKDVNKNYFC